MCKTKNWIYNQHIAHRGLHDGVIGENTMPAFEKAIEHGFAIETDIHVTKDDIVIVFHDDTLERATNGADIRKVEALTYEQLCQVAVFGENHIPTLQQLLELVRGRVPLLIEFKKTITGNFNLEQKADEILQDYDGEYAIQSFNPTVLAWYKKHRPSVLRGQLSSFFKNDRLGFFKRFVLKRMMFNAKNTPHFVSYHAEDIPNKYVDRYIKKYDGAVITWTIRSDEEYNKIKEYADNIIFEKFLPTNV